MSSLKVLGLLLVMTFLYLPAVHADPPPTLCARLLGAPDRSNYIGDGGRLWNYRIPSPFQQDIAAGYNMVEVRISLLGPPVMRWIEVRVLRGNGAHNSIYKYGPDIVTYTRPITKNGVFRIFQGRPFNDIESYELGTAALFNGRVAMEATLDALGLLNTAVDPHVSIVNDAPRGRWPKYRINTQEDGTIQIALTNLEARKEYVTSEQNIFYLTLTPNSERGTYDLSMKSGEKEVRARGKALND